ncbi:MAG: flagellar hook-associated protein FlgK [Chromatiales bacterium]|nr:flagellar hook-associated protein FlgK [Chromatiales bacterium]
MGSFVNNGLTGLLAAQRALQVTSNNVANVNTEGYTRQRVVFDAIPGNQVGNINIGSGVAIGGIQRLYDQFLGEQLRSSVGGEQRAEAFNALAVRMDGLLGNPDTSLNSSLQRMLDQVEALGRDPTSPANREQLLREADSLARRFGQLSGQLDGLEREINARLGVAAGSINDLAGAIAGLNERLADSTLQSYELLDRREQLLRELEGQISTRIVRNGNGSVDVLVGSGQPLVLGARSNPVAVLPDPFDPGRQRLAIEIAGSTQDISRQVSAGQVGGLLTFRDEALEPARRELNHLALGLATLFNAQHAAGHDLDGLPGGDFFDVPGPKAAAAAGNPGTATLGVNLADPDLIRAADYELRFDGTSWSARSIPEGSPLPLSGTGTAGDPLQIDGLSIVVNGAAAAGDRFRVQPAAGAAAGLSVALVNADRIAAGRPGTGNGDNSNALMLADTLRTVRFGATSRTLADLGAGLVSNTGAIAARSESDLRIQQSLRQQAELDVESASGVNLEEEAVNMLRYQEAFLAASKMVAIANDLFLNLLQAVRR